MRIAIEGCTHGELDKTYETLAQLEKENGGQKVDLLICCGDFQSTRNREDLDCMAVPDKYKDMCSFYKYYSGEKKAPVLTIFIGGNHEASNYLQELPYGGWVAPDIYYLGYAGVVSINGLRIGGISGIFNGFDYLTGHHEMSPYDRGTIRSVYHLRNLETFRLKQLAAKTPQIMLSHDWPRGIHKYGDVDELLRMKRFFREDIEKDALGSRPTMELLQLLKPEFWFSAHLHVKFPALVDHHGEEGKQTKFLALDKCLPRRKFLQVLEVGPVVDSAVLRLEYDPMWLAVLRSTNHLLSINQGQNHMPGPLYPGRHDFTPTKDEVEEVKKALGGDLAVPQNFVRTAPVFDPKANYIRRLTVPRRNPQTVELCCKLGINDPCDLLLNGEWQEQEEVLEPEAEPEAEPKATNFPSFLEDTATPTEEVDEEKCQEPEPGDFVIDAKPLPGNLEEEQQQEQPKKKLKRRNQAIYDAANNDD